jgi:hypothetical protein
MKCADRQADGVCDFPSYMITATAFRVETSNCGPFCAYKYPYEMVLEVFQVQDKSNGFLQFVRFLIKPGVIAGILLVMWYVP